MKIEFKADAKTVKQLEDAFSLLEKKVATKVLKKSLSAAGDVAANNLRSAIKSKVQSSTATGTRKLWSKKIQQKSYRGPSKSLTNKRAIKKFWGKPRKNTKWLLVGNTQDHFYARVIEKGSPQHPLWRKKGSENSNKIGTLPPRPIFMPTAERSMPAMFAAFERTAKVEIVRAITQVRFN